MNAQLTKTQNETINEINSRLYDRPWEQRMNRMIMFDGNLYATGMHLNGSTLNSLVKRGLLKKYSHRYYGNWYTTEVK